MFSKIATINFPEPKDIFINMMPIIMGDKNSIPSYLQQYQNIIETSDLKKGSIVYLTINEKLVIAGETQRRPGQHTDATCLGDHGGKHGGGRHGGSGIYIASNDGDCQAWQADTEDVDELGALISPYEYAGEKFEPNALYVMNDTTPHESLQAKTNHYRQFFRLTGPELGIWWAKHNTPNPLGVQPNAQIEFTSKFTL